MALAQWFWKHYNGDVTRKLGRSPLRKRFARYRRRQSAQKQGFEGIKTQGVEDVKPSERYRHTRLFRKKSFEAAKKIQDVEGIKPDTSMRLMAQPQ